jgi:hypothetical protein
MDLFAEKSKLRSEQLRLIAYARAAPRRTRCTANARRLSQSSAPRGRP